MIPLAATIRSNRLELHRRLLQILGQLSAGDRPLPRLTHEQSILVNCLQTHLAALNDLDDLERAWFSQSPKPDADTVPLPTMPPLDAIARVQIPGEPEPPYVREVAVALSVDEANKLIASGQWELLGPVQQTAYMLERVEP